MESATQPNETLKIPDAVMEAHGLTEAAPAPTAPGAIDEEGFLVEETPAVTQPPAEEKPGEEKVEETPEETQPSVADSIDRLVTEIAADRAERREAVERARPAPQPEAIPPEIKAGLEHEDETVRLLTKRQWETEQQYRAELARMQHEREVEMEARLTAGFSHQIEVATKTYNLTETEVARVVNRLEANPALLVGGLTFEDGVHLVFPGRAPGEAPAPAVKPRPVLKIVKNETTPAKLVAGAGGNARPIAATDVSADEDIAAATARGMKALGLE